MNSLMSPLRRRFGTKKARASQAVEVEVVPSNDQPSVVVETSEVAEPSEVTQVEASEILDATVVPQVDPSIPIATPVIASDPPATVVYTSEGNK